MANNAPILKLEHVSFSYSDVKILDDINLSIFPNEFIGIIGPNGGGKTTLLKIILGLIKPDQGAVDVFGDSPQKGRRWIGYVPQTTVQSNDFPISVFQVVLMGRLGHSRLFRSYSKEDKRLAEEALDRVKLLILRDKPFCKLSQGQKQRVYIARAMVTQPKILIMDEPTASLDQSIQDDLYDVLLDFKKDMSIVLVSHDIGVISKHVEKIACLNKTIHYHETKEITQEILNHVYHSCSVEMIAHGVPHRVLKEHDQ